MVQNKIMNSVGKIYEISYLGKEIEYETNQGTRKGTVEKIEHDDKLNMWLFYCVSPYGNKFRLTLNEIKLAKRGNK